MYKKLLFGGLLLFVSQAGLAMNLPYDVSSVVPRWQAFLALPLEEKLQHLTLSYDFKPTPKRSIGSIWYKLAYIKTDDVAYGLGMARDRYRSCEYLRDILAYIMGEYYSASTSTLKVSLCASGALYNLGRLEKLSLLEYPLEVVITGAKRGTVITGITERSGPTYDVDEEDLLCIHIGLMFSVHDSLALVKSVLQWAIVSKSTSYFQPFNFSRKFEEFPTDQQFEEMRHPAPKDVTRLELASRDNSLRVPWNHFQLPYVKEGERSLSIMELFSRYQFSALEKLTIKMPTCHLTEASFLSSLDHPGKMKALNIDWGSCVNYDFLEHFIGLEEIGIKVSVVPFEVFERKDPVPFDKKETMLTLGDIQKIPHPQKIKKAFFSGFEDSEASARGLRTFLPNAEIEFDTFERYAAFPFVMVPLGLSQQE